MGQIENRGSEPRGAPSLSLMFAAGHTANRKGDLS